MGNIRKHVIHPVPISAQRLHLLVFQAGKCVNVILQYAKDAFSVVAQVNVLAVDDFANIIG